MLQDVHRHLQPEEQGEIPYGVIFATFMATMILGALLFNLLKPDGTAPVRKIAMLCRLSAPSLLLAAAVSIAGASLAVLAVVKSEVGMFCMFLLFETCNGVYVPGMAYLRGAIIDESNRTGLYGLMKIPLFGFVIGSLNVSAAGGCKATQEEVVDANERDR